MADVLSAVVWPRDMVIEVDEFPRPLLQLLFARHAWELPIEKGAWPLSPAPATGRVERPRDTPEHLLMERWESAWRRCWSWYHRPRRDYIDEHLPIPPQGIRGPAWLFRDVDTGETCVSAFNDWVQQLDGLRNGHASKTEASIEREVADALVPAWERGLRAVVTLPIAGTGDGEWTANRFLTIAAEDRWNLAAYRGILRS